MVSPEHPMLPYPVDLGVRWLEEGVPASALPEDLRVVERPFPTLLASNR